MRSSSLTASIVTAFLALLSGACPALAQAPTAPAPPPDESAPASPNAAPPSQQDVGPAPAPPQPAPAPPTYPAYPAAPAYPPAPPAPQAAPQAEPPPPPAYHQYPEPRRHRHRRRHREFVYGQPMPPGTRLPLRYRYIEGTPLPEGYHIEERANRGLVGGGAALVGVPYLVGAFAAISVQGDGNSGYLAIPVIGPWLTLGTRSSRCGEIGEPSPGGFDCFMDGAGTGLLVASGVMQALGVGMITLGLVNTREYAVADYAKVHLTPVATPTGGALVLSGRL